MNPFSLKDKTILVTGASSGIGRAIAIVCSQMGVNLILTGRNEDKLKDTLSRCEGTNHNYLLADLNKKEEIESLVEQLPKLDGFVNSAGIVKTLLLTFMELNDINEILQTNSISVMNLTRLLIINKKFNKESSIVYISSINGNNCSVIGNSAYSASKAMLNGFMKAIALELASKKIRVNCVNPAMIETDILKNSFVDAEDIKKDKLKYPLKRYGKPEEVAYAVVYLLSDAAQWITGSSLVIDGGYTIQ
ncbi:MAG: SDR family oxidoreductase [Candidatus Symbiothrix sp.]|jgi:NAD(P)-dependent dehydrogenase (short-subunit alcohol dehydrogenase family)|nr:SDR family oxidoreductase [Candidatus Symbiothrix sp.]